MFRNAGTDAAQGPNIPQAKGIKLLSSQCRLWYLASRLGVCRLHLVTVTLSRRALARSRLLAL